MTSNTNDDIFRVSDKIRVLPVVHGSGNYTRQVRQRLLSSGCDCLAVALPPEFQPNVEQGLDLLPTVTVSCLEEADGTQSYVSHRPQSACHHGTAHCPAGRHCPCVHRLERPIF